MARAAVSRLRGTIPAISLLLGLLVVFGPSVRVAADAGPKPGLDVRVVGVDSSESYYLDLLVSRESSFLSKDGEPGWLEEDEPWIADLPIYEYDDGTRIGLLCHGFAIRGSLSGTPAPDDAAAFLHEFDYMAVPREFSVIVQDRTTGALTVSNSVRTTQFDALVQYDAGANRLTVLRNTNSLWWWLQLLVRIFLTVLVESLLALLFRFRRRRWLPVPVNLLTQGLLHATLLLLLPRFFQVDYFSAFLVLEIGIAIAEFLAYSLWMAEKRFWKPFLYSILANGMTMALGLWWLS